VSAISRVPLTSPPLYDIYGFKVADSGADLWDGTIDSAICYDERGSAVLDEVVYTGTRPDGSASEFPLGGGAVPVTAYGLDFFVITNDLWVTAGFDSSARSAQLYGVSSELTVPQPAAAAPAPASLTLLLTGVASLAGPALVRRRFNRPARCR
jgi:hypothetical protein